MTERGPSEYWPEALLVVCWFLLFAAGHFLFRDDESMGHRVLDLGLWLSVPTYAWVAVREYRRAG